MLFKFDGSQEYQVKAVDGIAGLLEGQLRVEAGARYVNRVGFITDPNQLDIDQGVIHENLKRIQRENGLPLDTELKLISHRISSPEGALQASFPNFSVEMETGTGKTYVYIRTAFELNKRYGFKRFIIVVPSIAVKEGVLKTFEITKEHFQSWFDNVPYKFYGYDSGGLTQIRQFTTSSNLEFMVMTLASFNKAMTEDGRGNVIHRPTDRLQGAVPVHLIQASRPILILDEPQNMGSPKSIEALAALNPLFALRYSATHREPFNLVYRLTPAAAYRQGLVKRIEVASVIREDALGHLDLQVLDIRKVGRQFTAQLRLKKLFKNTEVREATIRVNPGDNLGDVTNLDEYKSIDVDEIDLAEGLVRFSNGLELRKGEERGSKEDIFRAQIRYTIEEHFRKQQRLEPKKIKVLSLFFIDRVANYRDQDGLIRRIFTEEFERLKVSSPYWSKLAVTEVHAGYFSGTHRRGGDITWEDTTGEGEKDEEAYNLIMKDKERLLSFDSKVAFIFSHSALREGWDNPNIFQVCTLNQTSSNLRKRQEVGRGVRLAVDQSGDRTYDPQTNVLTVVANESYEQYVSTLQTEIVEEYGEGEAPPRPPNARTRREVHFRKKYLLDDQFKELWKRISEKTKYSVKVDSDDLVVHAVSKVDSIRVGRPKVTVSKGRVELGSNDAFEAIRMSGAKTLVDLVGKYPLPNLLEKIIHLLQTTSPPVRVTRATLLRILQETRNQQAALENPEAFANEVATVVRDFLADQLVNGIEYEKIGSAWEMHKLDVPFEAYEEFLIASTRSPYESVQWESNIEREFVSGLENTAQVKMYIKLPAWFTVDTPVGRYNPDWAIVWEDLDEHGDRSGKSTLYLVRETKGTTDLSKLFHEDERRKVICGARHFQGALGVDYKVVKSVKELP